MQEGTHQKQERALWLMEIGYQHLHYLIGVARSDDDLRAGVKGFQSVAVEVIDNRLDGLHRGDAIHQVAICRQLVWIPLLNMQIFLACLRVLDKMHAHVVKALDGAHAGGTHGDDLAIVLDQLFQTAAVNHDVLGVHLMALNLQTLHWLEGAGTHVQGYFHGRCHGHPNP